MSFELSAGSFQLRELRVSYTPASSVGPLIPRVGRPSDAATLLRLRLESEPVEVCLLLLLNTKREPIAVHELSRGTLDNCIVHPREVFKVALLANAAAVIVAHNHPSGDPTPSAQDIAAYRRLTEASEVLGVGLFDFLIIGAERRYYSFREAAQ